MNNLQFDFSVNHIIKYKNGECLYILKNLTHTPTTYSKEDFKPTYEPILHFVHATKKNNYSAVFTNDTVFSDKFDFVDWCAIPHVKKREIIKAYPELKKSLYDNFEYNQLYGNSRINITLLEQRVRDIAELGGYKKVGGIDLKEIEKEIIGRKTKEEPHGFFGIGSNYHDIRPDPKPDPIYSNDTGGDVSGSVSKPDHITAICNSLIGDTNDLNASNGITINNPYPINLYMDGSPVGVNDGAGEVLVGNPCGEVEWVNPMEGIVIRSNKKKKKIVKFKEQKAIIL